MGNNYYRVIEILDELSILINYGSEDGAEKGEEVRVIAIGPEVIDPETNETLGTLDSIKAELTIETTYKNFSLCKKVVIIRENRLAIPPGLLQTERRVLRPLSVDKENISHKKFPDESIIKIGDKVEIF